ncbi:MAG: hypothetical protein WD846_04510 [Patescibacteria group bacterium]
MAKPSEVYARVSTHLDPGLAHLGYRAGAARSFPWWYADDRGDRLFVSGQVDTKAIDPYAGGGFRLEFEKGAKGAVPNAKLAGRALFFQLLKDDELRMLVARQNELIASLAGPPEAHVNAYPEFLRPQYLSYFQPQEAFDAVNSWLRYRALGDVDRWMEILVPLLPILDQRARENLQANEMYLGRGRIPI